MATRHWKYVGDDFRLVGTGLDVEVRFWGVLISGLRFRSLPDKLGVVSAIGIALKVTHYPTRRHTAFQSAIVDA